MRECCSVSAKVVVMVMCDHSEAYTHISSWAGQVSVSRCFLDFTLFFLPHPDRWAAVPTACM